MIKEWKKNYWIPHYSARFLYAKCKDTCSGETIKILVEHERYLPIPTTNVKTAPAYDPLGDPPHPVDTIFDIEKDMREARAIVALIIFGNAKAKGGQYYCNKYNNV